MKYDAVIIGAGIGGLAAAARLADAGYAPIILEKQDVLGGRYTTGKHRGYKITSAAYYIVHPNGPVIQLLRDLGVESQVEIASAPDPYLKYRIDGKDHPVPQKGGAMALLPLVASPQEVERIQLCLGKALRWQEPGDEISFKDWLSECTDNQKVHQIFNMMCAGTSGASSATMPAGEFIRILRFFGKYGGKWVLPKGHLKPLVDAVVGAIRSRGGEIQTRAKVQRIMVEDLSVKGVVAEKDGKKLEIEAKVVINDCSPHDMLQMAGESNFHKDYLRRVRELNAPECFNIIWGCDKPMFDFAGVINFPQWDNPYHVLYAVDFSLLWRDLAPEGKYMLWAGFVLPPGQYDLKKEIERGIRQCKESFPDLEKHGEVLLTQVFRKTWPLLWAAAGRDLGQRTPVENLYIVGDGAKPSGHMMAEGVVEGARLAVEDIKARIKPGS